MTKHAFATRIKHNSDAAFREWVGEFSDALDAIGLIQTSDTGQIDIPTATRPAISTLAGYQIRRFNDSLQAAAPIFIKFHFGTGSGNSNAPETQITVGTGSDGAGNLTATGMAGTLLTAREFNASDTGGSGQTAETPRPSHFCHAEGFLGLSWKNSVVTGVIGLPGLFGICRTCNNAGEPDARGMLIDWGGLSGSKVRQSVVFGSSPEAYTAKGGSPDNMLGFMPQGPAATAVGQANQVALGWTITPLAEPLFGFLGCYPEEVVGGSVFQATPVGDIERTYVAVDNWLFGIPATMTVAMLWE